MSRKSTPVVSNAAPAYARRPESPRQLTSEAIEAHLAAFAAAGGKVEVLSTTQVLKRIQGVPPVVPADK
jgi:hypothetical protein